MAFRRLMLVHLRQIHRTSNYLSEDGFDFRTIVKSNSTQTGFNDLEKKKVTKKTTKTVTTKKSDEKDDITHDVKTISKCDAKQNQMDDFDKRKVTKKSTKSATEKKSDKKNIIQKVEEMKPSEAVSGTSDIGGNSKPQLDLNGNEYKVSIPNWMDVVLECPFNPTDELDLEKFQHFKNFVEELEIKNLPTVTMIIKKTEPEDQAIVLQKWAKRKTKELGGEKQFQEYRQKLLTRGSTLHSCIEKYMDGERDFEVEPHIEGPWESIQHVLQDVTDVRNTEKVVVHNELFYKGQIDCIASYRDEVSLIEWKVSRKPKIMLSQTYDNPLQVAAYIGALNRCGILKRMKVPSITTGVLVITYEDGEPANVHVINERICNKYWLRWKERLYHYWAMQYQDLMIGT